MRFDDIKINKILTDLKYNILSLQFLTDNFFICPLC